jgi:hypothetical protein
MAQGSTKPLTELSVRIFLPACRADKLTTICELPRKCGSLNVSQLYESLQPVTGLPFLLVWMVSHVMGRIRPPLWSSGQSSCLQLQRSGFDS